MMMTTPTTIKKGSHATTIARRHPLLQQGLTGPTFSKVWQVPRLHAFLHLLSAFIRDDQWRLRSDLDVVAVQGWLQAQAILGLPSFLRRDRGQPGVPRLLPDSFQIKSMC